MLKENGPEGRKDTSGLTGTWLQESDQNEEQGMKKQMKGNRNGTGLEEYLSSKPFWSKIFSLFSLCISDHKEKSLSHIF